LACFLGQASDFETCPNCTHTENPVTHQGNACLTWFLDGTLLYKPTPIDWDTSRTLAQGIRFIVTDWNQLNWQLSRKCRFLRRLL
jgi:hypothetical protein